MHQYFKAAGNYLTSGSLAITRAVKITLYLQENVTATSISIGGVDTSSLYQPKYQIAGYVNFYWYSRRELLVRKLSLSIKQELGHIQ
jgi:hypothetical protein